MENINMFLNMSSTTSNVANIQQTFMNNVIQQNQQNCIATFNQETSNNVVIVNGSTINGNVIGVQLTGSTDATCLITSHMEDSVSNILSSILDQTNTAATDILNGGKFTSETNTFDINQTIVNNISQINEATCAASFAQASSGSYFYVTNSTINGDFIGVQQNGDLHSSCSLNNFMKNATYNQAQASGTQSNKDIGVFASFLAVVLGIVGIMIIGTLILYSTGAIGKVGFQRGTAPAPQLSPQDRELQAAAELGLTSEDLQLLLQPQLV